MLGSVLACASTNLCVMATEDDKIYPLSIDGSTVAGGPGVGVAIPDITAVDCPTSSTCVVGGNDTPAGGAEVTTVSITGDTVTAAATPVPVTGLTTISSLSCSTASSCLVVGDHYSGPLNDLAVYPTGGFAVVNPDVGGTVTSVAGIGQLQGVSCPDAGTCYAAGIAENGHGAIVAIDGGAAGTPQVLSNTGPLSGISCAGSDCEAIGQTGYGELKAEIGGEPVAVPLVNGVVGPVRLMGFTSSYATLDELSGIDCVAATACLAVGPATTNASGPFSYDEKTAVVTIGVGPAGPADPTPPPSFCPAPGFQGDVVASAPTPDGGGYWETDAEGDVLDCGDGLAEVNSGIDLPYSTDTSPVVGMAAGTDDNGYYLVTAEGSVVTAGDAPSYGSAFGMKLSRPVVGMATTPDHKGYWLVAADGGVFSFGDAPFEGSAANLHLAAPIVGIAASGTTDGYRLVAADGGVFDFGAAFHGSAGGIHLAKPIVGIADDTTGDGYWLAASDGGVFSFGAAFHGSAGSTRLDKPIVGIDSRAGTSGYWLVAGDGGVFSYNTPFYGSGYPCWSDVQASVELEKDAQARAGIAQPLLRW